MNYLSKRLVVLLFMLSFSINSYSQQYKDGISVVCFTASFVENKELKNWGDLSNASRHRIDIEKNQDAMIDEGISVVPTIVIYDNGQIVRRWEANILFELDVKITDIQKEIDKVIESKF
tara:strand:- start:5492 stop:5848 length:357 start_codon:yes stop_codon:yes gene_type:complete